MGHRAENRPEKFRGFRETHTRLPHQTETTTKNSTGVSKMPTRGRGRGRGVFFFFFFFSISLFCDLFGTRLLLDGKVSVGLQRKILLKKLRNKWNCPCDKLPSVGSFSHENGHVRHVVNHFRVFLL